MAQPFAVLMTTNQKPEEERYGVSSNRSTTTETQNDSHNLVLQHQWWSLLATFNQNIKTKTQRRHNTKNNTLKPQKRKNNQNNILFIQYREKRKPFSLQTTNQQTKTMHINQKKLQLKYPKTRKLHASTIAYQLRTALELPNLAIEQTKEYSHLPLLHLCRIAAILLICLV